MSARQRPGQAPLIGRGAELAALQKLLGDVRSGTSRVLVIRGEPGVGKTALLDQVSRDAADCLVVRASGVESEMELAYAGVQQLCAPLLECVNRLPPPQRDALTTALGLTAGPAPDRLMIGLAVLEVFADAAEERPLLCVIDDLQWLDQASIQTLSFLGRRLAEESVGLVIATRSRQPETRTLPELELTGLADEDAHALLATALTAPIDERVRAQLVAETRGNPLGLLELPRGLSPQELAGGFGLPAAAELSTAVEESFGREVAALPPDTRQLLLLAAAEPLGDPALLWRAAAHLGIGTDAATPAVQSGLAEFALRVRFRHPLARSATYRSASLRERQNAHAALAAATDGDVDPDRRAWHRAQAAAGPDDTVADELDSSAGRARARGGLAAAGAFYQRAAILTMDPVLRTRRALAAAAANVEAGAFDSADQLLTLVEQSATDAEQPHIDLLRAQMAYVTGRGRDAAALLLRAAQGLESLDGDRSRDTYLEAMSAAVQAGRFADNCGVREVARVVRQSSVQSSGRSTDRILDGFALLYDEGHAAAWPTLQAGVLAARRDRSTQERLHLLWMAHVAAIVNWDDESWDELSASHLKTARESGALSEMPLALSARAVILLFTGDLTAVTTLVDEFDAVAGATGDAYTPVGALLLAAFRGDRAEVDRLARVAAADVARRGDGGGLTSYEQAQAIANNGAGDYRAALEVAKRNADNSADYGGTAWVLAELVEAAARCGETEIASQAHRRLRDYTSVAMSDWGFGIEARTRALVTEGESAGVAFEEAIERLGRTRMRTELARAHLLYGEWLRRRRRRVEARMQLRLAHTMLDEMGMQAFAERARRELQATGETPHKRASAPGTGQLTPQETQIARMASEGLSNIDIGARLFISARTVQYHLRKVFAKLGITSRTQLHLVLPSSARP